ncbi:MAG: translation initiation factor IF-3 [Immundisolibacteraceae bacterium]|nr:translation initiation factor IF-3 [Immundisolibacteraceae bacterium]
MAKKDQTRINDLITTPEVRLIAADGEQLGVVKIADAQQLADDAGMDLVEISPAAEPPVCKIMDFGKFLYNESKKRAAAKKNQKQVQVKEIKFRPRTDSGDYQIKLKNLQKFLENGDRAKVTMRFRGREMAHQELGRDLLIRVEKDLEEIATVEQFPRMEGRQMVMVLSPRK